MSTAPGIEDADPAYAARITFLIDRYLTNNTYYLVSPLLEELGCRIPWFGGGSFCQSSAYELDTWHIRIPEQPNPCNEYVILEALRQSLAYAVSNDMPLHADSFSLLHGIYQNQRWRSFLECADSAYCLAALCAEQTLLGGGMRDMALTGEDSGATWLLSILNEWLRPSVKYGELPPLADLCCALFGEAWYPLSVEVDNTPDYEVPTLIYLLRPAFRPGLVSARLVSEPAVLPALDGP
jgi:hypothetical protein